MLALKDLFYISCVKDNTFVEVRLTPAEFVEYMNGLTDSDIKGLDALTIVLHRLPILQNNHTQQ